VVSEAKATICVSTLTGLWNVVVVHTGKTPGEAYMMQPMMEWRRNNPPPETGEDE
jgi:hypothetical protein